jgi:hypothetical protein
LLASLTLGLQTAEEVVNGSQRTYPSTEESPEKHRGDEDQQTPEQPAVERMPYQGIRERDERIELKEQSDRIC